MRTAAAAAAAVPLSLPVPPPAPIQIRRNVPPAPKVPKWQATAYGELAKVPSAQAWTPDLVAARNVNRGSG